MAGTYTPIQSVTLGSNAASVTFSSVPSTYTDVVIRWTARSNTSYATDVTLTLNNDSSALYSMTALYADGSITYSSRESSATGATVYLGQNPANATANVFGHGEITIPNYAVSMSKAITGVALTEDNGMTAYTGLGAMLYRSSTAISEIKLTAIGANFVAGSTFHLYGIKSS